MIMAIVGWGLILGLPMAPSLTADWLSQKIRSSHEGSGDDYKGAGRCIKQLILAMEGCNDSSLSNI